MNPSLKKKGNKIIKLGLIILRGRILRPHVYNMTHNEPLYIIKGTNNLPEKVITECL